MANTFRVDNNDVIALTNKLQNITRSAFPLAVRGTLNDVAFLGRKESLPIYRKTFTVRQKTFFRSHLKVNKSINTFDVDKMEASYGVIEDKSNAGNELAKQEFGGTINDRDVPTTESRGGNQKALVKKAYYKKLWKNKPMGVIYQSGESRIVKTKKALMRVKRGNVWDTLFLFKRDFALEKRPFIEPSGRIATKSFIPLYQKNAAVRFKKYWKK